MKTNHSFWEKRIERRIEKGSHGFVSAFVHFIFGVAFVAVFGYVLMCLWNWLVPDIIGWSSVNYWQSLGLFALCKLLFGGFGGRHWLGRRHHHCHSHDNAIREKWLAMTPEERKEFIKKRHFHHRFGRDFCTCNETEQNEGSPAN